MGNKFSIADLKKQIALNTNSNSPDMEIELCYSGRHVLVKPLKVKEKKELLKSLESKNETLINRVLDDIIQSYVVPSDNNEFNPKELPTQERHQILVYIRAANGDEEAKIAHQCPKCEKVTKDIKYNLGEKSRVDKYKEPVDGKIIKICNDVVEIHYDVIYRYEEIQIEQYAKEHNFKTQSERQFAMVAASIKQIYCYDNGEKKEVDAKGIADKMQFLEDLDSKEFTTITNAINNLDFGVKMPFDFKCSHCDYESKEEVNVTVFFIS
jgi:hypothetical protein